MTDPVVSVITIFFNAERYFAEAIDSVLAQDFPDFELILADDGSTDGSTALAKAYAARDPRVRYVEHPGHANHGMSAARNLGLSQVRGEFVAFIDADDVWVPTKLRDQVEVMRSDPSLGMVCGVVRYWRAWEGRPDRIIPTGPAGDITLAPPRAALDLYPLGKGSSPCPSDVLIRRGPIDAVGGFEAHFTGLYEDQAFFAKLYLRYPVRFDRRIWLSYRQHEESSVFSVKREGRYAEVRRYFLEWLESYLAGAPELVTPAYAAALKRAFRPYRQPVLDKAITTVQRLASYGPRAWRKLLRGLDVRSAGGGVRAPSL